MSILKHFLIPFLWIFGTGAAFIALRVLWRLTKRIFFSERMWNESAIKPSPTEGKTTRKDNGQ